MENKITDKGWTAMREIFQAGLRPAVSRLYDPFDSFMARQGGVKNASAGPKPASRGAPGGGAAALSRVLRMPRALNVRVDGDKVTIELAPYQAVYLQR